MSFLDEINAEVREAGLDRDIAPGPTPPVFDWLLSTFSYQGISNRVARSYMERHGTASWSEIEATLRLLPRAGNFAAIGTMRAADTTRAALHVPSPTISTPARCLALACAMAD
jgi:hypothetical protein